MPVYLEVQNGVVINRIEWDPADTAYRDLRAQDGVTLVEQPSPDVQIGWLQNPDSSFSAPAPDVQSEGE